MPIATDPGKNGVIAGRSTHACMRFVPVPASVADFDRVRRMLACLETACFFDGASRAKGRSNIQSMGVILRTLDWFVRGRFSSRCWVIYPSPDSCQRASRRRNSADCCCRRKSHFKGRGRALSLFADAGGDVQDGRYALRVAGTVAAKFMNTKENEASEGAGTREPLESAWIAPAQQGEFVKGKVKTPSIAELESELDRVRKENEMLHWVRLESLRTVIELMQLPDDGHRRRRQNQLLDYVRYLGVFHLPPADWQMPKRERFALSA